MQIKSGRDEEGHPLPLGVSRSVASLVTATEVGACGPCRSEVLLDNIRPGETLVCLRKEAARLPGMALLTPPRNRKQPRCSSLEEGWEWVRGSRQW